MSSILDSQQQTAEQEWLDYWKRGPTRIRWTKLPLQVGDAAPDFELLDSKGKTVQLRNFWRDGPALLATGAGADALLATRMHQYSQERVRPVVLELIWPASFVSPCDSVAMSVPIVIART